MAVKLPFYTSVTLNNSEVPIQAEYVMSLTSAYDPDLTSTGGQPRGFDQWTTLYNGYFVRGVEYKILVRPSSDTGSTTAAMSQIVGVTAGPEGFSSANFTTLYDYMEYPKSKYHKSRITARNATVESENAVYNGGARWFTGYISNRNLIRYYGAKGIAASTQAGVNTVWPIDFQAASNADPFAENELVIWAASLPQDGASTPIALPFMHAEIQLVYHVEFYAPVFPLSST